MVLTSQPTANIVRTERGLTISGTRITLYDVMDHLAAGWTPKLLSQWLPLTTTQIDAAMDYINAHRAEVEAEYQTVLQEAQELRQYWDHKNQEHLAKTAQQPPKSGQEEIYAKLQAWKVKLGLIKS